MFEREGRGMEYQVAIYSSDAVFARMLEIEFCMQGLSVLVAEKPDPTCFAKYVLLDLDTATAPAPQTYVRMIGFTHSPALSANDIYRQCALILRRPFEMRTLRQELAEEIGLRGGEHDMHRELRAERPIAIFLDEKQHLLHVKDRQIPLSPHEFAVMKCLLAHRGTAVSKEELLSCIGESAANKLEVYICYLRRKTETGEGYRLIRTVRGKGYCII